MSRQSEVTAGASPTSQFIQNSGNGEAKAEKSRQCPICHVYYKYGNSYWQHVRYVHARILSQCVICDKSYKRTTMAKHHILHSHKIAWHLCGNYVRKIKKSDLKENQDIKNSMEKRNNNLNYFKKKTLHLISSFNCYHCPGSFPTLTELFEHVRCHRYDSRHDEIDEFDSDYEKPDSDYEKADSDFEKADSDYEKADSDYEKADLDYEKADLDYEKADSDYEKADSDSGKIDSDTEKVDSSYEAINSTYENVDSSYNEVDFS